MIKASVIIFVCQYGCLYDGKQISREMAYCLIRQYRHPALGWTEDPDNDGEFYHFYRL